MLVIALVLSMATAISGTLAYLTSTDTATNTFTVGNVSIDLEEPSYTGNNQTLLPGVEIAKDPQIKNIGSSEAWVWMEITVPTDLMSYIDWNTTDWTKTETTSGTNTIVTLKRESKLPAGETTAKAFTKVALPASLTSMPESLGTGTVDIVVNAFAIQDANFANVDAAIAAYDGEGGEGDQPETPSGTAVSDEASLTEALAVGGNVYLTSDIILMDTASVPAGVTATLNLNGHTISQSKECTESYSMLANNGTLTITGNGKLSFTDTGAGDPNVGWASYTIRNAGTLIVENGTIEHLGTQTYNGNNAIFHYSGSTTINGGEIKTPYSRSLRVWNGEATINSGNFEGQVWVQAMSDCKLTINGGSFKPATNGSDASSVFVTNDTRNPRLSVTDGNFATKIGCSDPSKLAGCITGGTFTDSAKQNTNATLFASSN